jgi:predicted negative regulator of RcsB-dependent stress response
MSESKTKSSVVVVASKHHGFRSTGRKTKLAAGTLLLLIAAGSVFFVAHYHTPKKKAAPVTASTLESVIQQANKASFKGNTSSGIQTYDSAIASTSDKTILGNLYMQRATLEVNANMLDQALSSALQADQLLHAAGSSALVAIIYAKKGDKTNAAVYYRKAATLVPAPTGQKSSGYSSQYYLSKAQQLSGTN